MSQNLFDYHSHRAEHCRSLAAQAHDRDIRRRHEQLATLHAACASRYAELAAVSELNIA